MPATAEQLWDAIERLAREDGTADKIPPAIIAKLIELKMATLDSAGLPQLTPYGDSRTGGMIDRRCQLVTMLADINSLIAKAESLTITKCDDDTLQRASKVLAELKEQRRDVEAKLRGE